MILNVGGFVRRTGSRVNVNSIYGGVYIWRRQSQNCPVLFLLGTFAKVLIYLCKGTQSAHSFQSVSRRKAHTPLRCRKGSPYSLFVGLSPTHTLSPTKHTHTLSPTLLSHEDAGKVRPTSCLQIKSTHLKNPRTCYK